MFYNKIRHQGPNLQNLKINNTLQNNGFILDDEIRFHIEKIPLGLNFFDLLKFKKLTNASINGNILKSFKINDYLVYVYSTRKAQGKILFLDKIDFLKSLIVEKVDCELWVIRDIQFLCIGMLSSVPIFMKFLQDDSEIINDIQMLIEILNQYSTVQSVRFFCCGSYDFYKHNINVSEYSEQFMTEIMGGTSSINEYCMKIHSQKHLQQKQNIIVICSSLAIVITSLLILTFANVIKNKTTLTIERFNSLAQNKSLPSREHYLQIKQIENNIY